MKDERREKAWLLQLSGPHAGTRHPLADPVTRVGRGRDNDVVLEGQEAAVVSSRHLEIRREGDIYLAYDLESTNGTFIDGERVNRAELEVNATLQLGLGGPELVFRIDGAADMSMEATAASTLISEVTGSTPERESDSTPPIGKKQEALLSDAIKRARIARLSGEQDQTGAIMREMLGDVVKSSSRKFKVSIALLAVALVGMSFYSLWAVQSLKREKMDIDEQIQAIEVQLREGAGDSEEIDRLIEELNAYQEKAEALQQSLLYRLGVRSSEQDFVESEIRTLMAEFGAEVYSIPPEFREQVHRYIQRYQGPDKNHMSRALGRSRSDLETVQRILVEENLPGDLAFIVLVESAFIARSESDAGAVGIWQFTANTARAYGLAVTADVDERLDIRKSTRAASRYIRELILDFGSGSSVMLALAAYNLGPGRVKRAVRRVEDPIKQRNFWYLYRIRALPAETRAYVPKIFAAIIIGRNPERFGF